MGFKTKVKAGIRYVMNCRKEKIIEPIITPVVSDKLLSGKVALVTGGSSGIGLAISKAFLDAGAKVIIAGSNRQRLDSALAKLEPAGGVRCIPIDVRVVSQLPSRVCEAAKLFDGHIDILVNSAGLVSKHDFFSMTEDEYDGIMDTNLKGTYFISKEVAKLMIEKNIHGHILNISSSSSLRPAWTPYQLSKWGIKGFTLGLADLLIPYGITVNAIAPGPTATPMLGRHEGDSLYEPYTPAGRYSTPEEIASLAVFMVSGAGDMIVGDTVYMTGGSGNLTLQH